MTQSPTLIQALASALKDAVKVNGSVQVRPAAVLWTDAEAQWASVLPRLRAKLPSITQLGAFKPSAQQGPAIWLKCAIAGSKSSLPTSSASPTSDNSAKLSPWKDGYRSWSQTPCWRSSIPQPPAIGRGGKVPPIPVFAI